MKSRSAPELLDRLIKITEGNLQAAQALRALAPPDHQGLLPTQHPLNLRPRPEAWSVLECLEHLNIWNVDYLLRVKQSIAEAQQLPPADTFTSTWLGNKLAASMKPKARKIKTLKKLNPAGKSLGVDTIDTFLRDTQELLELLKRARGIDLSATRIKTVLSAMIKMRTGDALRLIVYHNQRHVAQAERAVQTYRS